MLDEQMLDLDGQLAHAHAGRVVDRRSRGSGEASQADLADPTCTQFINLRVGKSRKCTSIGGTSALTATT